MHAKPKENGPGLDDAPLEIEEPDSFMRYARRREKKPVANPSQSKTTKKLQRQDRRSAQRRQAVPQDHGEMLFVPLHPAALGGLNNIANSSRTAGNRALISRG